MNRSTWKAVELAILRFEVDLYIELGPFGSNRTAIWHDLGRLILDKLNAAAGIPIEQASQIQDEPGRTSGRR